MKEALFYELIDKGYSSDVRILKPKGNIQLPFGFKVINLPSKASLIA